MGGLTAAADEDRLSLAWSRALSLPLLPELRLCSACGADSSAWCCDLRDRGWLRSLVAVASGRWRYPRGLIDPMAAVELLGGPLQLFDRGWWVLGDEYWGEVDGAVPVPLVEVAAGGARRDFEFEQLLPGGDDPAPRDPIEEAIALRDVGQLRRAVDLLEGLVEWDSRCLDAHAHLGLLAFDRGDAGSALPHYAAGVCVAEGRCRRILMECWAGDGWATVFSALLHGLTLSAWRLELYEEAEELCWALLWLNPGDHLGAAELLAKIVARQSWTGRRAE